MKTAVSIPDAVFADADRLAQRMRKSRSQLYSEALAEYLARHDPDAVTAAMDAVCEALDTRPGPLVTDAAHRVLRTSEW
jgi:predicted transcriptional regulator